MYENAFPQQPYQHNMLYFFYLCQFEMKMVSYLGGFNLHFSYYE